MAQEGTFVRQLEAARKDWGAPPIYENAASRHRSAFETTEVIEKIAD